MLLQLLPPPPLVPPLLLHSSPPSFVLARPRSRSPLTPSRLHSPLQSACVRHCSCSSTSCYCCIVCMGMVEVVVWVGVTGCGGCDVVMLPLCVCRRSRSPVFIRISSRSCCRLRLLCKRRCSHCETPRSLFVSAGKFIVVSSHDAIT